MNKRLLVVATGGAIGLLAVLLVVWGNPPNMGYCIACFIRDISGSLGFHKAPPVQYMRPEILGMIAGAFGAALLTGEYKPVGGSSPLTRFFLAFIGMIGMLIFLGCPVRAVLRLAGGDLNALAGLAGLVAGVAAGIYFLRRGFSLGRAFPQHPSGGYIIPVIALIFTVVMLLGIPFFYTSTKGPGAMHAPVVLSLLAGLSVGILAQRSRFCMIGGIRDFILVRDIHLLTGFFALLVLALLGNLITGSFRLGFVEQPVAHADGLWNFLGMVLAGTSITLLGGCPLRQLIAAGEGNTDCAVTILGFLAGAAFAHNFGLAASPQGVPVAGQWATVIGLFIVGALGFLGVKRATAAGGVSVEQSG